MATALSGGARRHESRADDAEAADQRGAPRFALLLRTAKLTWSGGEYLCIVRDVSQTGGSLRLFHPVPPHPGLTLELGNGDQHLIEPVWQEPWRLGFRFCGAINVERILTAPSAFPKRALRVKLRVACEVAVDGRILPATLRNLSQQGAMIETAERLFLDQRVALRAPGLLQVAGRVRWHRDGRQGLALENTFQFGELARFVRDLQRPH